MIRIVLLSALAALAGCATDPATTRALLDAQAKQRPTLAVTCPAGGCSVEYTDPRDRGLRLPTNGYDAAIAISGQITHMVSGAVVPAAMAGVAVRGFDAMRGHGSTSTTTTTTTTDAHNVSSVSDSHATTTTTDSTHTPTVVTQPAPIVVNPVVVTP